jgi:mRNA interferase YafQ
MKHLFQTTKFTRDIKRMRKRGKDLSMLQRVVKMLVQDLTLPQKFKDHALTS